MWGTGIYLAEFGRKSFGNAVRFTADVLNGIPSIVIGIEVLEAIKPILLGEASSASSRISQPLRGGPLNDCFRCRA